jgi:hypothetical protein
MVFIEKKSLYTIGKWENSLVISARLDYDMYNAIFVEKSIEMAK